MTLKIVAPDLYDRRPGVLRDIAQHVGAVGDRAFILGGKTALRVALPAITQSLEAAGVGFETQTFSGQPTLEAVERVAARLRGREEVVVVGVGGGRALDTAKAAAVLAKRQIVTVPTVAATCASWAALSILYTADGRHAEGRVLPYGPRRILVDPDIVAGAPARFLAAGIADSVVKWYETAPNLSGRADPFALRLQGHFGGLTLDTLEHVLSDSDDVGAIAGRPAALADTLDSIIALAGLCGSARGEGRYGGFAHPFYFAAARHPETHGTLHGAIVGFGLLAQFALEDKPRADIDLWIERWSRLSLPVRLADLGIVHDAEAKIEQIAADAVAELGHTPFRSASPAAVADAIREIDAIGQSKAQKRVA